ncbi:MAG: tetratricopeptide repeat protein [Anaerolineae bacterium]|jgi:Flp pilus assembly protein TadD|nr:tetratricopeptide repeat protein [Anaerolineae bacterium]MBT7073155.1 tetratricopeptide repeat protein [Anaerolineae bacterium]MBT7326619.1 tetratricopeptide repeat protein [Anaerolineae bacterium]
MRQGSHFNIQIEQLITEIKLSLHWRGPLILFAPYRSRHVVDDAEKILLKELEMLEQTLTQVQIHESNPNPVANINALQARKTIFSFKELNKGGGEDRADTYRFLNLHREFFIEGSIRCIFWITEQEIQQLAFFAPDFWAFRHRVIDFIQNRATPKRSISFRGLIWQEWPWGSILEDRQKALAYRQALVAELPKQPETTLLRINLYAEIAGIYLQERDKEKALETLKHGQDSLPANSSIPEVEAKLLIGLATIHIQMENYAQAYATLQKAMLLSPSHAQVYFLLGQVSRLDERRSEALTHITKALRIKPDNAAFWNEAGNIYAELGRDEKALDAYQKAFELSESHPYPLLNKSAVLASTNRIEEARELASSIRFKNDAIVLKEIASLQGFEFMENLC